MDKRLKMRRPCNFKVYRNRPSVIFVIVILVLVLAYFLYRSLPVRESGQEKLLTDVEVEEIRKRGPNIEYEKLRFRLFENTLHLSNFFHWKISQAFARYESLKQDESFWRSFNKVFDEYIRFNLKDVTSLNSVDGFDNWRERESKKLEDLIRRRLDALQNPKDFKNAKKLLCIVNHAGYTAMMFRFAQCLFIAYGTERTMVLKSNWSDLNFTWLDTFIPPFKSYTIEENISWSKWPGNPASQVVVYDGKNRASPFKPMYLPADLAPTILRTHSLPVFWLASQFLKYLWRPRPEIKNMMFEWEKSIGFKKPIVGIHVRRTDKVYKKESRLYKLEEYMYHVEEFYKTYEVDHLLKEKHVYIATDDEQVFSEMRKKYPGYKIIGDESIARLAAPRHRGTRVSLHGLLKDIHILSLTDFVVCDFRSNVCRLAYAMRNFHDKNAIHKFRSVGRFYDQGHFGTLHKAIHAHRSSNSWELELEVGDVIESKDYCSNGSSIGKNFRTRMTGIYPTIKVAPFDDTYNFPTYPQVPVTTESGITNG